MESANRLVLMNSDFPTIEKDVTVEELTKMFVVVAKEEGDKKDGEKKDDKKKDEKK